MAKTIISASAHKELQTKSLLNNTAAIDALRKPSKMTATLKRRALKKKIPRKEVQILSSGSPVDFLIASQPK